jgi:hypothetical protein
LGLAGIGAGLLVFLADRLEWGMSSLLQAILIVLAVALVVVGIAYVGAAALGGSRTKPLRIHYALEGGSGFRMQIRTGHPQTVLLRVGLENPNPFNLEGVAINSLIPQGLQQGRCGSDGQVLDGGHWLSTPEKLGNEPGLGVPKDYWADENVTVAGEGTKLIFFKLRVSRPGSYFFKTLLFGSVPKQYEEAMLEVVDSDSQTFGGTIGELISEGERLTPDGPVTSTMNIQEWVNQLVFLTGALPDEDRQWWSVATAEAPALDSGWTIRNEREVIAFRLPLLYALRRRLDRPAEVVDDKAT